MSGRAKKQEDLRREREEQERLAAASERRSKRVRIAAGGGFVVVAVGAALALGLSSEAPEGANLPRAAGLGTNYDGLVQRRIAAGVVTMGTAQSSAHIHPQLSLFIDGKPVQVPANIGVDPNASGDDMAALHTHTPDGLIHDEGQGNGTLGQFFAIWGVALSADRLGSYRTGGGKQVQMWVDGKPTRAFGGLRLQDEQKIVLSYGRPTANPPGTSAPSS
ncbi:hypothetical protein AB0L40_01130 [Patulibacter sp. NPDC049589]|uniref:hypothetical protein n=1 Tax=Patulibacter sp. NPDC049589 TaxID=3154731 RepID=UPI003431A20B